MGISLEGHWNSGGFWESKESLGFILQWQGEQFFFFFVENGMVVF